MQISVVTYVLGTAKEHSINNI